LIVSGVTTLRELTLSVCNSSSIVIINTWMLGDVCKSSLSILLSCISCFMHWNKFIICSKAISNKFLNWILIGY
jgi:hypothetical protein